MATSSQNKYSRRKLIAALKERIKDLKEKDEKERKQYEISLRAWQQECLDKLTIAVDRLKKLKTIEELQIYSNSFSLPYKPNEPMRSYRTTNSRGEYVSADSYEVAIKQLEMMEDEFIYLPPTHNFLALL